MAQQVGTVSQRSAPAGTTNGSEPPARAVRRRRGLPGSRAVVGGLLVAASAVGLFAAASSSDAGPGHSYVVARLDLAPALTSRVFDRADALVGATLLAPLGAGELVQTSAVVARRGDAVSREL